MSEQWKPSVRIWPYKDAPEEFRRLNQPEEGDEELLIHVPREMLDS